MFLSLWNYLKGYVIVEVKGYALEKFMNLILHQMIPVWDVSYEEDKLYFTTMAKDFKRLKPYAKKARCRVRIRSKKGLPFLSFRYRKRKVLVWGVFLFLFLFYFLSSFVFQIEVIGNQQLQETDIIQELKKAGFSPGKFKGELDLRKAEQILSNTYDEIVWVGVHWQGTKMVVQLAEAVPKPKIQKEKEACHLVAKRDGLITYIVTDQGMPLIKKGDTVTKGSILVSGQMQLEDEVGTFYYTQSKAKIRAKTGYTLQASIPAVKLKKEYTSEVATKWSIRIFDREMVLWDSKVSDDKFDTLITIKQFHITDTLAFPIFIQKEERVAYTASFEQREDQKAMDLLEGALYQYLQELLQEDAQVLVAQIAYEKNEKYITATFNALVEEDISEIRKIDTSVPQAKMPAIEGENE